MVPKHFQKISFPFNMYVYTYIYYNRGLDTICLGNKAYTKYN